MGTINYPELQHVDLTIGIDNIQEGAAILLQKIRPQWKESEIIYKTLIGGLSNMILSCRLVSDTDDTDCVLVRRYGDGSQLFRDREKEVAVAYILNAAGCAKPLYARFNNGVAYGFQPGICPSLEMVREPYMCRLIATEVANIHSIDIDEYTRDIDTDAMRQLRRREPSVFKLARIMLKTAAELYSQHEMPDRYKEGLPPIAEIHREFDELADHLTKLGSPVVLCHGDIIPNNVVYNEAEGRCHLIDFEVTDVNHQAMDIATHLVEWIGADSDYSKFPDRDTQLMWIQYYLEAYKKKQGHSNTKPSDKDIQTLYVQINKFTLLRHLLGVSWAILEAKIATFDFDYLGLAIRRYNCYRAVKEECLSLILPD